MCIRDRVKASLRFKGRQMAHRELGYAIINRLIQDMGDAGIVEFMPRMEGTTLHAIQMCIRDSSLANCHARVPGRAEKGNRCRYVKG